MADRGDGGSEGGEEGEGRTVSWRELLAETAELLRDAGIDGAEIDARRIVEQASGHEGSDLALALALDEPASHRAVAHLDAMVARRSAGAPLQYVLGRWGFRRLDLLVDHRVLIPRPETEQVAEAALEELRRLAGPSEEARVVAVDLGTGSGAIGLAIAVEEVRAAVWATDRSTAALEVARANLAGIGRPATRVRLVEGDWFAALPEELRGAVDVVVANPPYVAADDDLPAEVADWEPAAALVSGPTGLEALDAIVAEAPDWLRRPGSLVVELAPDQSAVVARLARAAGFDDVEVRADLAGRDRMVVARLTARAGS